MGPFPWQAVSMTDDKPEPAPKERVRAELDELMAKVLRHLRTGHGSPLEELGLDKAADQTAALAAGYPRFRSTGITMNAARDGIRGQGQG